MSNLEKTLFNFAEEFQTLLKEKVIAADMIASGALNNSIEVSSLFVNNKAIQKLRKNIWITKKKRHEKETLKGKKRL